MSHQTDSTTLVCLFHTEENAQAAMNDLRQAGVSHSDVALIGGPNTPADALERSALASLGMPDKDYDHLKDGIRDGGLVLSVTTEGDRAETIEEIFAKHSAKKIDEAQRTDRPDYAEAALPTSAALATERVAGETAVPVVAEELIVGKRTVNQGGVRVYRRVVELPVEQAINLREEHVVVERRPMDREVTNSDLAFGDRTIEFTETAEEAVISKNARVVEEVLVGKQASEHVETIHDTIRKTVVDVEELPAQTSQDSLRDRK